MVDAVVSKVLEQLVTLPVEEAKEQVRLVAGVDHELEKLKRNFLAIQAVLVDAEQRQYKDESVRFWLKELKHASYDMEDVLDEWITARRKLQMEGVDENALVPNKKKVCSLFPAASCFGCKQVFLRHDIALKINSINQTLNDIAKQKDMFNMNVIKSTEKSVRIPTTCFIDVSEIRGRDEEIKTLKNKLLFKRGNQQNPVQIISIVGMGGIGKTTLAGLAYKDGYVIENFEKMIWVCVSEPFDQFRIVKAIVEAVEGSTPNLGELQSLLQHLHTSIAGKKFLLVLDDVWTEDRNKWEPLHNCLKNGGHGSKILVTTRKESVALMMESIDVVSMKKLSEKESWSLFKRFAFVDRSTLDYEHLEEIGRNIVDKCKGLPLAVKTIGSLLRFKRNREEWQSILDSELWHLEEFEKHLLPSLLLSYNDLPSKIKQCFLYCAIFLKDYKIEKDELIKLWMAQGYIRAEGNKEMEMIGEEYFNYLASRSLFQEFKKDDKGTVVSCKMHDMIHDFAQFLTKDECLAVDSSYLKKSSFNEKLRHVTLVLNDKDVFPVSAVKAKKLRSLLIHNESGSVIGRDLFGKLTCLRALKIYDESRSIHEFPKEIEKLVHLKFLKLDRVTIEKFPETCCELTNLQILEMRRCYHLTELPQGIGKLVDLRHLIFDNDRFRYMPKGIERLTCLRTLSKFVRKSKGVDGSKACKLEGLKHLNHLRGSTRIELYGNVSNIDEAKSMHLHKKKNLDDLVLDFHLDLDQIEAEYEAICEACQPPQNLVSLTIGKYEAKNRWPNWIVSLHRLKKLTLSHCPKCEIVPPLGKLSSLEILSIYDMWRVKRVGEEFLGTGKRDEVCGSTSSSLIAFPKLKYLSLKGLVEWEEWDCRKEGIAIMPQLNYLYVRKCGQLRSLPDQLLKSTTLKKLEIRSCSILEKHFKKGTGESWPKISHIPNIIIGRYVTRRPLINSIPLAHCLTVLCLCLE